MLKYSQTAESEKLNKRIMEAKWSVRHGFISPAVSNGGH